MNSRTLYIKDFERVFVCSEVARAKEVTWTKFPVDRNSTSYRRLMRDARGRSAFCVFIGVLRLVARGKTGGALILKGNPITCDDIEVETGIPLKAIEDGLALLQDPTIGWVVPDSESGNGRDTPDANPIPARGSPENESFASSSSSSSEREGFGSLSLGAAEEKPVEFPAALDTPEFRAKWDEWLAYRRERHLPKYTRRTVQAKFRTCERWGVEAATGAIDAAIENGWNGFFRPKGAPDGRGKQRGAGAADRRADKAGREYDEGSMYIPVAR